MRLDRKPKVEALLKGAGCLRGRTSHSGEAEIELPHSWRKLQLPHVAYKQRGNAKVRQKEGRKRAAGPQA